MLPGVTTLREPLIRALGAKNGKALESIFGLRTVGDLLRHYPRRYYTRGELTDLSALRDGDHVTVLARVASVRDHPLPSLPGQGRRGRTEVVVTDERAKLVLTFFFKGNFRPGYLRPLVPGSGRHVRGYGVHLQTPAPAGPPGVRAAPRRGAELRSDRRTGRRVRRRDAPGVPGQRQIQLLEHRQGGQDRPRHPGRGGGPAPRRAERTVRAGRAGRGDPRHPPAPGSGRPDPGQEPAQVGRGLHAAGRAGTAPAGGRRAAGHAAATRSGRHRRRLRRRAAVHAHGGAGGGGRDHRGRPGLRLPDAPAAAG